jgi:hypothetical protein
VRALFERLEEEPAGRRKKQERDSKQNKWRHSKKGELIESERGNWQVMIIMVRPRECSTISFLRCASNRSTCKRSPSNGHKKQPVDWGKHGQQLNESAE